MNATIPCPDCHYGDPGCSTCHGGLPRARRQDPLGTFLTETHQFELMNAVLGMKLAHADSQKQAAVFLAMAERTAGFDWCMQCCHIREHLSSEEAALIANMLDTFLGHMKTSA